MEVRNTADSLVYTTEKTVRDHGDKIPADVKKEIDAKTTALKSALQGQDVDAIRSATQELTQVMQKVGASVYQQPGQPPPGGQEPGGKGEGDGGEEGGDEGTVEGEFREV
jgi:molecular chaperone DnaK